MNLLKAYYARVSNSGAGTEQEVKPAMLVTTAHKLSSVVSVAAEEEKEKEDVSGFADGVLRPWLKNSEMLADLGGLVICQRTKAGSCQSSQLLSPPCFLILLLVPI